MSTLYRVRILLVYITFATLLLSAKFTTDMASARMERDANGRFSSASNTKSDSNSPYRNTTQSSQVRVVKDTPSNGVANAVVYHLSVGQSGQATPFTDLNGQPLLTDSQGYLPGDVPIAVGDQLVALLPISSTSTYTLYYMSAAPTITGLDMFQVTTLGLQTLSVSADNPLLLFNLHVSLEWDARNDSRYIAQLQFNFRRESEILFDLTNGQVALGQVTIYHDRQSWNDADIRIYASNRLRLNATQGGIVNIPTTDPSSTNIIYQPGQVRLNANIDRFGDDMGIILSDRGLEAFAHELGHYLFYLDDNYLGVDDRELLIPVETCQGTMSEGDPSEFRPDSDWLPGCRQTLANQTTGRSDWSTITTFYPWLHKPTTDLLNINPGPNSLPLAVTKIADGTVLPPSTALDSPIFVTTVNGVIFVPGKHAQAFLFRQEGDQLIDLGGPIQDLVLARGARVGDRLCLYDLDAQRLGCTSISSTDDQLRLFTVSNWRPDIIVTPVTSHTIEISVTNVPAGLPLRAKFFPAYGPATPVIMLLDQENRYSGTFSVDIPDLEGYVQVWVDEVEPRREIVTAYALGGSPGHWRSNDAPATSLDGQVILYGRNLVFRPDVLAIQSASFFPPPPPRKIVVGHAYRLITTADAPSLAGASISFNYIECDVPPTDSCSSTDESIRSIHRAYERGLRVFFWNGETWQQLQTARNIDHNFVSAYVQGPGLYVLMSSFEVSLPLVHS